MRCVWIGALVPHLNVREHQQTMYVSLCECTYTNVVIIVTTQRHKGLHH